jgi:RNA polymerase sigma-70 factor (ECF subfamily)
MVRRRAVEAKSEGDVGNDRRLAQRIVQGDRRAFEEFVDAYGSRVHRLVKRYVTNPDDADDLTQSIFIELFRCIGSFRGEASLQTWVYRVALNHCMRHCRRSRPPLTPYDEEAIEAMADPRPGPALEAARVELSEQVQGALQGLSPLHRDVVVLHELHGLSYQECAEVLEVPVGTVKSRLANAFRRLREALGDYVLGEAASVRPEPVGGTSS